MRLYKYGREDFESNLHDSAYVREIREHYVDIFLHVTFRYLETLYHSKGEKGFSILRKLARIISD